uniref:Reverse transcriptase zinc-binding domain-containing protein n=1 Tax=Quercus lobata TaxID=97700 RepID=A0A7N2LPB7_QUELO
MWSAYRMLMEAKTSALLSSSSPMSTHRIWKKIWKLKFPNKIRHFLWRAAKDSFPTKQNLRLRHIPIDDTCDGCSDQSESLMHCLWLCDQARAGSGFRCALFAMIAWFLWERRNRMRERQRTWQFHEVGDKAKELV